MEPDLAAIRKRYEAASARLAYWESQWRASASGSEKEAWYDAIVSDLNDAAAGFADALEALEEAQEKLDAVRTQAAGALECAANDLEALAEGVEFERGENAPWALVRKSIDRILKEE